MKVLCMETIDSVPSEEVLPQGTWGLPAVERRSVLQSICNAVVQKFTNVDVCSAPSSTPKTCSDQILSYATELLSLGLFYLEYADAVREGDGFRVLRCWRYLFLLFRCSGRKNYTIEAFRMLYNYHFVLSPRQAHQLIWSRFVNTSGLQGRNVACDLHMEHLNRTCKDAMSGLGANKTPKAITRIGKCIGVLKSVLESYDDSISVPQQSDSHSSPPSQKDRDLILKELLLQHIYDEIPGRKHSHIQNLDSSIFSKAKYHELSQWIAKHVPE